MQSNRWSKIFVLSMTICSLITTSVGGAFASTALAATPEVQTKKEEKSDKVVIGLAALGLLAMLTKHSSKSDKAPAKTSTTGANDVHSSPAPSQQAPATKPAPTKTVSGLSADEKRAIDLMNADRAKYGLPPLKVNFQLVALAERYAQDMINRGYFSHYDPEGRSPFDRMRQAGISFGYAGENLAINRSVEAAEQAFMNSSGHRANILSPNYTEVGIGVKRDANGSVYVVQEFISR